jgi:hypothetical protein
MSECKLKLVQIFVLVDNLGSILKIDKIPILGDLIARAMRFVLPSWD